MMDSQATRESDRLIPSDEEIRTRAIAVLGKRPCQWQINVCKASLRGTQDIISVSATGTGKTLTFWLPLLFRPTGIQIVVTPLNILGQQNVDTLSKAGVKGIFISSKTATRRNFEDIASLKYRVVVVNPEVLMRIEGGFQTLFKNKQFTDSIISFIIDEAHCVSLWGSFRPDYRHLGDLRHLQRSPAPVMATSATLTPDALADVKKILAFQDEKLFVSQCSIDRPNINLAMRPMLNTRTSFFDLKFLLCGWQPGCPPPPKFLVFFDSIPESVQASHYLRSILPVEYREKVKWFNSEMSDRFKAQETIKLINNEIWGLMATDSFGMGMDVPDIMIVVQWGATCTISTLWQRFGRCVRDPNLQGMAVLFTEKDHLDLERQKKAERAEKRKAATVLKKSKWPKLEGDVGIKTESGDELQELDDEEKGKVPKKQTMNKVTKKNLDPGVDMFINAGFREYDCRRRPIMNAFKNNEALQLHHECDPGASGCARCSPKPYGLCCDLHNPDAFTFLDSPVIKASRQLPKSYIPAYAEGALDVAVRSEIEAWRCQETRKTYGKTHLRNLGPGLIMAESIRDRIVMCAHVSKIHTIEDLEKETKWGGANQFGDAIIAIINKHYPPEPAPSITIASTSSNSASSYSVQVPQVSSSVKPRKKPTCSVCHLEGHTMRSSACKANKGRTKHGKGKENIPPEDLTTSVLSALPGPSSSTTISVLSTLREPSSSLHQFQGSHMPDTDIDEPLVFKSPELEQLYYKYLEQYTRRN